MTNDNYNNIDFKKLSNSDGYKKLKKAVLYNCKERDGENCFNIMGCNKRKQRTNCFHNYCDTFKWVIDRVRHYSYHTKLDPVDILNAWEANRDYSYMNYYQDYNQPKLTGKNIFIFDNKEEAFKSFNNEGFRCPICNGISNDPYKCDTKIKLNVSNKVCDWKAYGLFGTMGKGAYIFLKDKARGENMFMPVALEKSIKD